MKSRVNADGPDLEAYMSEPDRGRIAEIIAGKDNGRPAGRGSGYRVTSTAVLTAAHVVAGARSVRVRFNADLPGEWSASATILLADPAADIAILAIATPGRGEELAPALFGTVGAERAAVLDCTAVGFPRFKMRPDPLHAPGDAQTWYRDSHQANGTISPLANW